MRPPELHPLLQGAPSPATRQSAAIHQLAAEANTIVNLIELLKGIKPQLREDCDEGRDAHLRHVEYRRYREAHGLIINYGVPKDLTCP